MKVTFLGTGVAVPFENRAQSSMLIEDEGTNILIDAGIGCYHRLEEIGTGIDEIEAICITHHHLDHNGDVLNILKARWLLECDSLTIFGPPGSKAFFESLLEAYPYLRGKLRFSVDERDNFRVGSFRFKAIKTHHSIESRGYVVDDTLAVSGDTRAFREFVSQECEVMVHELSLPFGYEADTHTTPENLKSVLGYCKASKLYLTHLYPMTHAVRDRILEYLEFDSIIAQDRMSFRV